MSGKKVLHALPLPLHKLILLLHGVARTAAQRQKKILMMLQTVIEVPAHLRLVGVVPEQQFVGLQKNPVIIFPENL